MKSLHKVYHYEKLTRSHQINSCCITKPKRPLKNVLGLASLQKYCRMFVKWTQFSGLSSEECPVAYASVNSSCAQPLPPPGLLRGICPPCHSRGWGICKFCAARWAGICQPQGHSRSFDTHAVSYQNITTQRILLGKKADWLICQDRKKLETVVKACS